MDHHCESFQGTWPLHHAADFFMQKAFPFRKVSILNLTLWLPEAIGGHPAKKFTLPRGDDLWLGGADNTTHCLAIKE